MSQISQKRIRGLEAVAELLRRAGVDTAFGLLGGSNAAWVAHAVNIGQLRFIRTRHEETAVTAAAGYSRAQPDIHRQRRQSCRLRVFV